FFFQAEDGIRDLYVTGVQTCALPICWREYLVGKRLNTTAQRETIVDQFFKTHDHISIDELLARVRRRQPRVGYATVYRTLKLLRSEERRVGKECRGRVWGEK